MKELRLEEMIDRELLVLILERMNQMAQTVADLDAAEAKLAASLAALTTLVQNLAPAVDLTPEVTGVNNATGQVNAVITKLGGTAPA